MKQSPMFAIQCEGIIQPDTVRESKMETLVAWMGDPGGHLAAYLDHVEKMNDDDDVEALKAAMALLGVFHDDCAVVEVEVTAKAANLSLQATKKAGSRASKELR